MILDEYYPAKLPPGFGTRPSATVIRERGRRYFIVKCAINSIGELRSEAVASAIGIIGGFSVQEAQLCLIPKQLRIELELPDERGVICKYDVRRRKDKLRGHLNLETLKKLIYKIFQQGGFKLNDPKTVIAGKARRQKVTGLVVNQKVNVGKELERKIRQEIFFIQKFGLRSHLLKIGVAVPPKQYLASLKGRAAFLENINPKNKKYRESLEEVRDEAGPGLN